MRKTFPESSFISLVLKELVTDDGTFTSVAQFMIAAGDRSLFRAPGRVLWQDRHQHPELSHLSPPAFANVIYGDRVHGLVGMTFADLKAADVTLYYAVHQWIGKHRKDSDAPLNRATLPEYFALITREEATDEKLRLVMENRVLSYARTVLHLSKAPRKSGPRIVSK